MRYQTRALILTAALTSLTAACSSDSEGSKDMIGDPSTVDDGSSADDSNADDGNDDGASVDDSNADDGASVDDGNPDDGNPDDGNPDDGNPDDGNPDDGNPDDGNPDDGNPDDGNPDDGASAEYSYFRADTMALVAPKIWGQLIGPIDATGQVNDQIKTSLTKDEGTNGVEEPANMKNPDGYLDFSELLRFVDPSEPSGDTALGGALCPVDGSACLPDPKAPFTDLKYTSKSEGTCLEAAGKSVAAPCWVTDAADLKIVLGTIELPLKAAHIAGRFVNDGVESGLMYGFLTEAAADETKLPSDLPGFAAIVGIRAGAPISSVLHDDEQDELDGVKGWWFTASYTAKPQAFDATP